MSLQNGNGRRDTTPTAAANTSPALTKQAHPEPTAQVAPMALPGTEWLASGNAYSRVSVTCSRCGHTHFHVKFEVNATRIVRSPACAKHTEYEIEIVTVVPSQRARREAA